MRFLKFLKAFILYFFTLTFCQMKLQLRIINTKIVDFIPCLKLHSIVLINNNILLENNSYSSSVYSIDFSPKKRSLFPLLFGLSVPGEIRIRHLQNTSIHEEEQKLTSLIHDVNRQLTLVESQTISDLVYYSINNKEVKEIVKIMRKWNTTMNLYFNNCRHFTYLVKKYFTNYY